MGSRAVIADDLAIRHGRLLRGVVLSEPPLFSLDPDAGRAVGAQLKQIGQQAATEDGQRTAVDAFFTLMCPGLWVNLDDTGKDRYRTNADIGFTDLRSPPLQVTPADLSAVTVPVLVITGESSQPALRSVALTADGTVVSEVIRKAIQDARCAARRDRAVAEMEAIMADPEQRRISEEVYREMKQPQCVVTFTKSGSPGPETNSKCSVTPLSCRRPVSTSTTFVCATSTSARPALHPTIVGDAAGTKTQVLTEQQRAVDNNVLGPMVGHLLHDDVERITEAIGIILDL